MEPSIGNQPEDRICDRCRSLNLSRYKFTTQETVTASSTTITGDFDAVGFDSADLGFLDEIYRNRVTCSFCRLLYNASHSSTGSGIGHDGLNAQGRRVRCSMEWHHDCRGDDSMPTTRRLRVFSDDAAFTDFYVVPILPSSTEKVSLLGKLKDREAVDYQLLSRWHEVCSGNHESCQAHQKKGSYPFKHPIRLLDVNAMRLCEADMTVSPVKYAALSYVWGRQQTITLCRENLQALLHRAPEEALPNTVQDAITVVRELGLSYIWVDALCIIQDDDRDKMEQIASMSQIYQQATLSICVAYGSSSQHGIPGVSLPPGAQNVGLYQNIQLTTLRPVAAIVGASMWDSRAWTFQERLLSTRCAIFTAGGMIWQCPTTTWREDIESSLIRPAWTLDSVASPLQALQGNPLRSYINCVNIYSGRLLSFLSDKLVAFTGLTQILSRKLSSKLEYGMPLRYLDWALLWEPESTGKRIRVDEYTGLVSWSWCGWEQKVNWRFSSIEGTLFNLHNWLTEHTWIVWYLGDGEKWNLAWDKKEYKDPSASPSRWDGYTFGHYDEYGRSVDVIRRRNKRRLNTDWTHEKDDENNFALSTSHRPGKGFLLFQTFTSWFALSRKSHSKQTDMGKGLHRFGLTDKLGDWCGTVILDTEWFNSVGGLFEFAAISDAKEFSFEELDTWNYYISEERQQAEWYCFYALMLRWEQDANGEAVAERVGLAKIYQSSFFSRSFKPCSWKSIVLS
ncbi:HET domain-containing protein [Fusarium sp. LHS14.1]|nr:HET domain-containing protein [Fusarium sp. LHS14.1]